MFSGMMSALSQIPWVRCLFGWLNQFADPIRAVRALSGLPWYFADWRRYSRLPGSESIRIVNTQPALHDRTPTTPTGGHYFFCHGWAMRRILANRPSVHVDVSSHSEFVSLLAGVVPVVFLEYRPLKIHLSGLSCVGSDILQLPFASSSVMSLSCLHVAEHIGLGRYGDSLDPLGTKKAALELMRVISAGGNLYFAVPIGRPRLCFNAHRIHATETICEYFSELELVEFSGVHDNGQFVEHAGLSEFQDSRYACGLFWFRKR